MDPNSFKSELPEKPYRPDQDAALWDQARAAGPVNRLPPFSGLGGVDSLKSAALFAAIIILCVLVILAVAWLPQAAH